LIQYRYNEKKYAETILKQGFLTQYHKYELKILVKYYKEILGKKASERKELIYKFCEDNIVNFNRVKYFKIINSALSYGSKGINKLISIESIPVTKNEIDYINSLELDDIHKKILFSFIVKNKLNKEMSKQIFGKSSDYNFFGGKNESYKEVFEMSKLSGKYNMNNLVNDLSNLGYVDVRTRGKINLSFINNIRESNDMIFEITNFDNVGYYLDWFNGDDKFIKCENNGCDEIIKKTNGNKKYCSECALEKEKIRKREWKRENSSESNKPCISTPIRV
jgi:ribosomal protein L37E